MSEEAQDTLLFSPSAQSGRTPIDIDVLAIVADPVICTDEEGRMLFFNAAAERCFGYSAAEVLGQRVEMLLPERYRDAHVRQVKQFGSEEDVEGRLMGHQREVWGRRKNGEEFPGEAALSRRFVDGRTVLTVVHRDITLRKDLEEQREAVAQEMDHRIKNLFTVFSALVWLSAKNSTSVTELESSLQERIKVLAGTQSFMGRGVQDSISLADLLDAELGQYRNADGTNINIKGEEVSLRSTAVQPLALAFHELGTNSIKYGAFSHPQGRVTVTSERSVEQGKHLLLIEWRETGGPLVKPPERQGFGTSLIKQVVGRTFQAEVLIDYRPEGLVCRLSLPSAEVEEDTQP